MNWGCSGWLGFTVLMRSIVSDSFVTLWTAAHQGSSVHGILQARVSIYSFLQGIFQTQGSNLGLLHCRQILYHLSHQRNLLIYPQICIT